MPKLDLLPKSELSQDLVGLIEAAPMPGLDDGPRCETTSAAVNSVLSQGNQSELIDAGLWLLCGELDRSHDVSQSHGSAEGSFWHGIMHRREGDFGNAKYWFQRTGIHSVHSELADHLAGDAIMDSDLDLAGLTDESQLASTLVDRCKAAISRKQEWKSDLERICWWEWQLLMRHCLA